MEEQSYWWYVLYVRTNTERKVIADTQKAFEQKDLPYRLEAFCPETEKYYRKKELHEAGRFYLKRPLFPGYVFIETDMPSCEFLKVFSDYIYNSQYIIRVLRYGDSKEIALSREERERFEYLFKDKRCVEHSVGYIVGDAITVTGGPLIGMEGSIKRIDRHNRTAEIEIDMFNQKQTIVVALEIVSKS